jgi:hypothetical protein
MSDVCPYKYKYELVAWACKRWPNEPKSRFQAFSLSQLYAIYHKQGNHRKDTNRLFPAKAW